MPNLLLVLFLLCYAKSIAQDTEVVQINRLGQEAGLLQLNAQALTQDSLGYLWIGTEDGLHRFNGYSFKPYLAHAKDSTSIPDDHIRGLLSVNDTLWIATNSKGIAGYKRSENRFFNLYETYENSDLAIAYKILKLDEQTLLFSTRNHIIIFDRKSKAKQVFKLPKTNKENFVTDVVKVSKNTYWLATTQSGILIFNLLTKEKSLLENFEDHSVYSFLKNGDIVYIASGKGLQTYNLKDGTVSGILLDVPLRSLFRKNEKSCYIASNQGTYLFTFSTGAIKKIIFKDQQSKVYENVHIEQFVKDNKGNLWMGTAGEGVFHSNVYQDKFASVKVTLPTKKDDQRISVFPFYKRNDSILWMGTTRGTLKYNLKKQTFKQYQTGKNGITYCFAEDEDGTLWTGGIYDGLMKYNPKSDTFEQWLHNGTKNSLPDNEVLTIIPMENHKLWLCTWSGGISEFNTKTETFTPVLINGKQLNRVRVYLKDSKENLWLGTDQGLYKLSNGKWVQTYLQSNTEKSQLTNDRVFALNEDQKGMIWIGTSAGLTKLNPKTDETTLYYKQKGFPNDFVYTILIDDNCHIWMSTNYGLSVLNTSDNTFKNYTEKDGLQDNEFNGKSGFKDDDGTFYFGGINGFNSFDPENIVDNPYLPNVYVESVELFNKPIDRNELFKDSLRFESSENVLTFNFAALNYLNPQKVSYQYKLKNFDKNWSPPSGKRSVTYTNLNPGKYTLKIKASNDAGVWGDTVKTLRLIVVPPWYQTTVFKVAVVSFLIFVVIAFYLYQTRKLKRDKLKLEHTVYERTQDLIHKNEDLKAYNEVILKQRNNIEFLMKELSHRVKNNLQIVSSLLNIQTNSIKDEHSKEILTIAKNRILAISYVQAELSSKTDEVNMGAFIENFTTKIMETLTDEHSAKFELELDLQKNIICKINITLVGLILNELITNTFKYAFRQYKPQHLLSISCKQTAGMVIITIKDNGKGYSAEAIKRDSLGLDMVNEMVHQLNGTIATDSSNGVVNKIEIPCTS
ncbi:hypothetical protein DDV96_09260 [Marixanthomonas spongiae]|uniref:Histidine kinase domain-containing protein n=1 Tax=Marixanthomonas spongiae TaxID=2174845 RepID=A0A2U0I0R6_9FLAO|nr:hypothetical protein DDV96_09260 [Marixanthomonas spongiae]